MKTTTWMFFLDEKDRLTRICMKRFNDLYEGSECFPEYAGKRVRCIGVVLEIVYNKPFNVVSTAFTFVPFDSNGFLNKEEVLEETRLRMNCLDDEQDDPKVTSLVPVINMKKIKEKFEWKPSPAIVKALKALIFTKNKKMEI